MHLLHNFRLKVGVVGEDLMALLEQAFTQIPQWMHRVFKYDSSGSFEIDSGF